MMMMMLVCRGSSDIKIHLFPEMELQAHECMEELAMVREEEALRHRRANPPSEEEKEEQEEMEQLRIEKENGEYVCLTK